MGKSGSSIINNFSITEIRVGLRWQHSLAKASEDDRRIQYRGISSCDGDSLASLHPQISVIWRRRQRVSNDGAHTLRMKMARDTCSIVVSSTALLLSKMSNFHKSVWALQHYSSTRTHSLHPYDRYHTFQSCSDALGRYFPSSCHCKTCIPRRHQHSAL